MLIATIFYHKFTLFSISLKAELWISFVLHFLSLTALICTAVAWLSSG